MEIKEILKTVDHTLLKPEATWADIKNLCNEGVQYGVASVCVPASHVASAVTYLNGNLPVCTVIGFPSGYSTTYVKCFEGKKRSLGLDQRGDQGGQNHVRRPCAQGHH